MSRSLHWLGNGVLVALVPATVVTSSLGGYLGLLTAAARRPLARTAAGPRRRFVILVPAHDEEAMIARALDDLDRLDYPRDRFEVHVVADNCSDSTAAIVRARRHHVHERVDVDRPGKGFALNWLLDRLVSDGNDFEAVVIMDADTTIDPGFLIAVDDAMAAGARAVQGFYGVRDHDMSDVALLRQIALTARHHIRPLGRRSIGASCGLYGNGMAFDRDLVSKRRWSGHLVEDVEFMLELVLDGETVVYVPTAVVRAEMPHRLEDSRTQNERWERGRQQVVRHYVPRLLSAVVSRGGRRRRLALADAAIDQLVPPLSVLCAGSTAVAGVSVAFATTRGGALSRLLLACNILSVLALVVHGVTAVRAAGASSAARRLLFGAPRFVLWKLILWARVLVRGGDVTWTRTARSRDVQTAEGDGR